uniref:BPTI/Kunitz inhibitor domain-containing protein n=1 Tax=Panagrolaimus sp. ES5 TaxID=591445 RepID=A0AC34G1H2_9BILA
MYYFDTRMSVCQPFVYKGCGGNENRYKSLEECRKACSGNQKSGAEIRNGNQWPRFAWSEEIQSCWRFSYYGANGNYNNFPNFQSCIAFCSNKH